MNEKTENPCSTCGGARHIHTHGGEKDPDPKMASQDVVLCPQCNKFKVYHWDTFDDPGEDTHLVSEHKTLEEADVWVKKNYKVSPNGADQVHIVHDGNVIKIYQIT